MTPEQEAIHKKALERARREFPHIQHVVREETRNRRFWREAQRAGVDLNALDVAHISEVLAEWIPTR